MNRVEIRIAVIGDEGAGKESFSKMLFLDNSPKCRVDPLSKLADMYLEIDFINSQNSSRKIIDECKQHKNLIMQQSKIENIQDLRDNDIRPYFCKHTNRVRDLINNNEKGNRINKYIMLTFFFIGNNYKDFKNEMDTANIIIYLIDINKEFKPTTELFSYVVDIIKKSNAGKYLLTFVNKCDNLNYNGEFDSSNASSKIIMEIDQIIRSIANQENLHQYMLPAIPISVKYCHLYRQIIHNGLTAIDVDEKTFIANMFGVKKNIIKDILSNSPKYLKQSGYNSLKDVLSDILNTKYRSMVDNNFNMDLQKTEQLLSEPNNKFISALHNIRYKAVRMTKIFKQDYYGKVDELVKKFLEIISNDNENFMDLDIIDELKSVYKNNKEIMMLIDDTRNQIQNKVIKNITNKLYVDVLARDIFLPSKVHIMFDQSYGSHLPKEELTKFSTHICDLYSFKARTLLNNPDNLLLLFDTYFVQEESMKLMSMFNELVFRINFDLFKKYLIQIILTKLMVAEKCIEHKTKLDKDKLQKIISYCISLKYHLLDNVYKKYDHLFNLICDICSKIIFNLDNFTQITYVSENLESIISFRADPIINLDKFIIKTIKKSNYQALIAEDGNDSNEDSDVEIYENPDDKKTVNFDFTKDDMDSDDESLISNDASTQCNNKLKKSKTNFGSKVEIFNV